MHDFTILNDLILDCFLNDEIAYFKCPWVQKLEGAKADIEFPEWIKRCRVWPHLALDDHPL